MIAGPLRVPTLAARLVSESPLRGSACSARVAMRAKQQDRHTEMSRRRRSEACSSTAGVISWLPRAALSLIFLLLLLFRLLLPSYSSSRHAW